MEEFYVFKSKQSKDVKSCFDIRKKRFVEEQGVPEESEIM